MYRFDGACIVAEDVVGKEKEKENGDDEHSLFIMEVVKEGSKGVILFCLKEARYRLGQKTDAGRGPRG